MSNNIKNDLIIFNELIKFFLEIEQKEPVSKYIQPGKISHTLDISLKSSPASQDDFKNALKNLLINTPKSSSKKFFNQLFGGRHSKSVLGDLLAVFLNNSMATYKIAGPQVSIEKEILKQVCNLIGYNEKAGGTFPTGGSMSNFMSLLMARDKLNFDIKNKGVNQRNTIVAYASENAHYSVSKNASFSGIGKENVRYIKCDKKGRMLVADFEKKVNSDIIKGKIPFYLNATAGTTVMCSFDNVKQLASICKKNNIWLHLDGAFGGTVIFSEKYRHLVEGVDEADSFCFNAHKTLGTPLSTSVLVVKNKEHLYHTFNNNATYLYQTHNSEYNLGQTSFECGRRNNALKFWTMWKAIGTKGISNIIDHEFFLAGVARNYILSNMEYTLYSFENSLSVCFNYKDYEPQDLCTKLYEHNILMVGFGYFNENKFIRLVTINAENQEQDILSFFNVLEKFCLKYGESIKKRR